MSRVLGFHREADAKKFHKKMLPFEKIKCRFYPCDTEDIVIIESQNYKSSFSIAQVESVCRLFKDADIYLANSTSEKTQGEHLLVFNFGMGYYAILTPLRIPKRDD